MIKNFKFKKINGEITVNFIHIDENKYSSFVRIENTCINGYYSVTITNDFNWEVYSCSYNVNRDEINTDYRINNRYNKVIRYVFDNMLCGLI